MEKEVLIHLLAERVKLHGWKITKVPKDLQTKVKEKTNSIKATYEEKEVK